MLRHGLLLMLFLSTGCSQLMTNRTYLSEMEYDDTPFYNPSHDFPVMAGDTGRRGRSLEDYAPATPRSREERYESETRLTLRQELRQLEDRQNQDSLEFYEAHKHKLVTVSERIYFLKLPTHERSDYLSSRGLLEAGRQEREAGRMPASHFGVRPPSLNLGMTKTDVLESWGKPSRVEVAGNPMYENERWAYSVQGGPKYIYFESGSVQGWE